MELKKTESNMKETSRIEAFSDGVFAIAITLLVLDIHVPVVKSGESLLQGLLANWETYLAFLVGFFTLLVCWINHHYMFELICRNNGMLLLLNGFKLLVVSFTPFATALLSKYIGTSNQQTAVTIYALNFFLMGTAMTSIWLYATRHGFTKSDSTTVLKASDQLYIFASVLSGVIFILSFFSIWVCLALFGFMFLVFVFPKNVVNGLVKRMPVSSIADGGGTTRELVNPDRGAKIDSRTVRKDQSSHQEINVWEVINFLLFTIFVFQNNYNGHQQHKTSLSKP